MLESWSFVALSAKILPGILMCAYRLRVLSLRFCLWSASVLPVGTPFAQGALAINDNNLSLLVEYFIAQHAGSLSVENPFHLY